MASPQTLDTRSGNPRINADLQDVAHQLRQGFASRLATGGVIALKIMHLAVAAAGVTTFGILMPLRAGH